MNQRIFGMMLVIALGLSTSVFADDTAPAASAPAKKSTKAAAKDDKVDISDLETKYWAPKDTDFSVVQNRTYTKEHRWFLSPQVGMLVNDSYSTGNVLGLTGNYFFSERYGIQISAQHANLKNNDSTNALANSYSTGIAPNHDRLLNFYGVGFDYVPFYAKMSFMGKKIIYFDMAITPVIGTTQYEQITQNGNIQKSAFTYGVDITQYFFFTNWFALRADLNNHWSNQDVVSYATDAPHGITAPGQPVGSKNNLDTTFLIGATFYY